ncbi:MAG: alpha-L-fucosidase [Victivallaceae bacterium]|nr:alpha-L-fucosidase [Victivallaceae bacterium]
MNWFKEKRFGMFVHWGLYAIPAKHEQYWQRWDIPRKEYLKLAKQFNPQNFDPAVWLDLAEAAGMEYLVFTAKHHDGFCMWDTKQTEFNIMNSPYSRDILAMLADECHKRDFPLVIYYSVVDWYQPTYPNIGRHHEIVTDPAQHDMAAYVEFVKAQISELCSNYGKIHGIWWDMNVPEYQESSIHQMIRKLQPEAIINNRGFGPGDFSTPEREWDPEGADIGHQGHKYNMLEACQSVGLNSWGYNDNEDYYSSCYLMECIDRRLATGANYLLNIGPDATGTIPAQATDILLNIGKWLKPVRSSFDAVETNILEDKSLLVTQMGKTLYVHCPTSLNSSTLELKPIKDTPAQISLLNTGQLLDWTFMPIIHNQDKTAYLRIKNIPTEDNPGPLVLKIEFK